MNWFQIKAYAKYTFKKKYRKEGDFNSTLAKELYHYVINNHHPYYFFNVIDRIKNDLLQSKRFIEVSDLGAGSKKFKSTKRKISHLVKYNASSNLQGKILSKLVAFFKPKQIIELGTSLGIGTLYLALPNSKTKVDTIEGCPNLSAQAKYNFKIAKATNINIHTGDLRQVLPSILAKTNCVDLVFFDGHHNYDATINYFNQCLNKISKSAVFIFDDIYWSPEMAKCWSHIKKHHKVSLSFDFFRFGIVVLNIPKLNEHYLAGKI